MAEEIMKGIYRLGVPLPKNPLRELNAYLITGRERNLLIDTGFRQKECLDALRAELERLDVQMEKTDILLTHLHSDHTGLVADIASEESRVFIDPQEKTWLIRKTRFLLEEEENGQFRTAGFSGEELSGVSETHPGRRLAPDPDFDRYEDLREGDVFETGDYRLELIRVPGHTPGQMCLWMEDSRTMFCADHVLFDITPNITKWPDMDDALGKYLESLKKISRYPVERALPGHRASGDFHQRIEALFAHHTFRLSECENIVRNAPGLTAYEIAAEMTWKIRAKNWEEFPASQKWFAVGECLAHLDYLMARDRILKQQDGVVYRYEAK